MPSTTMMSKRFTVIFLLTITTCLLFLLSTPGRHPSLTTPTPQNNNNHRRLADVTPKQQPKKKQQEQARQQQQQQQQQLTAPPIKPNIIKTDKILNILSLGGSVTYGAMLNDPSNEAYPALFSPPHHVDNMAIRATGADYPSKCIESMIGDKKYDVILLEFTLNGTTGMKLLFRRLRDRFPDAIIIYVHLYSLAIETRDETNKSPFERGDRDASVTYYWSAKKRMTDAFLEDVIKKEVGAIGGYVYEFPRQYPPMDGLKWFSKDWHHLSKRGHKKVAGDIADLLMTIIPKSNINKGRLGSWGQGDECKSWFFTGSVPFKYTGSSVFKLSNVKYTLQFPGEGTVHVMNHKSHPIPLYLSFMTWWSNYPVTDVYNGGEKLGVLDPRNTNVPHHITRTMEIGMAKPGLNVIKFVPRKGALLPFRLTGIILCGVCNDYEDVEKVYDY